MNILQRLTAPVTFCVTLNDTANIASDKILGVYHYAHPVYNPMTLACQQRRAEINGQHNSYFCGAYWYNGFHEDGARSAVDVAAPGSTIPCTYSVTTLGTTATSPKKTAPVVPSIEMRSPS